MSGTYINVYDVTGFLAFSEFSNHTFAQRPTRYRTHFTVHLQSDNPNWCFQKLVFQLPVPSD